MYLLTLINQLSDNLSRETFFILCHKCTYPHYCGLCFSNNAVMLQKKKIKLHVFLSNIRFYTVPQVHLSSLFNVVSAFQTMM